MMKEAGGTVWEGRVKDNALLEHTWFDSCWTIS